jgi:RND family efflux transporter MFP subunit
MSEQSQQSPHGSERRPAAGIAVNLLWLAGGAAIALFFVLDPLGLHLLGERARERAMNETRSAGSREPLFYRNPMDPTLTSPVPAKDSMGMDYVPVYAEDLPPSAAGSEVRIPQATAQSMNLTVEPVARRSLRDQVRTVGYLEYDQQRMVTVTTKYSGFVEKVYVNYVGEPVKKGQPLFEIYSPELVQTERELLSAADYARRIEGGASEDVRRRAHDLLAAARARLGYWDISPAQIDDIERGGVVVRTLTVEAPVSGLVMRRITALEGMGVTPGMELYHLASLDSLLLSVEVFEDQLARVRVGDVATVTLSYLPGESFTARVRYIEPEVSEKTRTVPVLLEIANPRDRLRAGMYATVIFEPEIAHEVIAVPALAVLRTGQRNVVVVQSGPGTFEPREVNLGREGGGFVEVLDGLAEGESVVTSAQFLIDSEARLQEAVRKLAAQQGGPEGH